MHLINFLKKRALPVFPFSHAQTLGVVQEQSSVATGGLSVVCAAGHENMWLLAVPQQERRRGICSPGKGLPQWPLQLRGCHEEPIGGRVEPWLQALLWPNECFWCKGLRRPRGGRGEFEDLCLMILSALVSLSTFYLIHVLQGDALPGLQPNPKDTLQGTGKFLEPWAMAVTFQFTQNHHQLCFLSVDEEGLHMLTWLSGKQMSRT